ncbi:hypothetical protein KSD_82260 [Ktedonobacter sp. SOSP1-85]|uniref:hypothetical protein n=1 Tax=Ktedonobacter sp. SOSP1-85 TaxID=2778367 RepID=UPI001915A311|nr:hypothetical protein [Ktedonobacter sp. SOSP1-85]GHO80455.1 hypothetical protein KSD_82260 [Ktedonobacter sp. SOSP1-85]
MTITTISHRLDLPNQALLFDLEALYGQLQHVKDRRDRTLQEDHSQLRMDHAPHVLALLNNTAIGLMARRGETNLPHAKRTFSYQIDKALSNVVA